MTNDVAMERERTRVNKSDIHMYMYRYGTVVRLTCIFVAVINAVRSSWFGIHGHSLSPPPMGLSEGRPRVEEVRHSYRMVYHGRLCSAFHTCD